MDGMLEIWDVNRLVLFILFFVPGFISLKVYGLLIPEEPRKAVDSVIEAIAYSCINYAIFSWLILLSIHFEWGQTRPLLNVIVVFFVLFVSPIALSVGIWYLRQTKLIGRLARHPVPKPWDYVFSKGEAYWVIIELKDGQRVGGIYDTDSFTSSFPHEEQIYLEEVWQVEGNVFKYPVERSKGLIVSDSEIKTIELFR